MRKLPIIKQVRKFLQLFIALSIKSTAMAVKWITSGETGYQPLDNTARKVSYYFGEGSTFGYLTTQLQQHIFFLLLPCILLYDIFKEAPIASKVLLTLLTIIILICIYRAQDLLIYQPHCPDDARFNAYGLPDMSQTTHHKCLNSYEVNWIPSFHAKLDSVFFLLPPELRKQRPTILYFHGNAGSIGHRIHSGDVFHLFNNCEINLLIFDYRGYGLSTGEANEWGLKTDAEAALDWLRKRQDINTEKIVLFGRSLGGALAINLARKKSHLDDVCGVIVENTFTDIRAMCGELISKELSEYVPNCLIRSKFESIKDIEYVQQPIQFISGQADQLIPPRMMETLHETCCSPQKQIKRFRLGNHNNTWMCKGYYSAISSFLNNQIMN